MAKKYTKKSIEMYLNSGGALKADGSWADEPKQLSQQEIDEVNRRRKQGTGSLPVLKYSSQNDKVVPNTQEKEIVKGGLSSTLDSVAKIPTRRIPTLSPVSQYASASNASNDVPDTKYTGSVPVLKNQKADNSLLVNDTKNIDEVKSVMSKWASDGYVMSKNEKKQAKELLKNYGYYDTQKSNANVSNMLLNKLKEQYGEEFVNNMNTVANRRNAGAGFVAGVTDSVLTLPEFALNKAGVISDDTYKDIKSESETIKANNPVTSLAGSLLGNVATYGAVNKALSGTGLAEKIGASATKTLNKVPFVGEAGAKAVGQSIGNIAVGEMADIALDTAPTIATNEALGKYRGENGKNDVGAMAKDIGVNLGVNALFNGVSEIPSLVGNYRRIKSDLDNLAYHTDDIPVLKDNSVPKVNNAPIDTNTIADGTKDAVDSGKPLSDYFSISDQQKAIADEIDNLKAKVESGTSTDADWESALRMIDDNKAQIKSAVGDGTTRVLDKEATNTALREAKAPWYSVKNASGMRKNKSSVYVDADTLSKMGIKGKKGIENADKWLGFKITKNPSGDKIISSKQFLDALPDDIKTSLNLTGDVASDMQKVAKHQSRLYKDYFGKNPKGAIYSDGENVSNLLDDYMKSVDEQLDSLGKTEQRLKNSIPVVDNTKYRVMAEDTGLNNRVPQVERPESQIVETANMRERGYAQSIQTKSDLPDEIKKDFADNPEMYVQLSNKGTKEEADLIMQNAKSTQDAVMQCRALLEVKDPTAIPLGYDLSKRLLDEGDLDGAVQLVRDMSEKLTESGQFSQSAAITLLHNEPMAAFRYIQRDIDALNADGLKKFGKKWKDFSLTDEEIEAFKNIDSGDTDAIKELYQKIGKRIEKEYPSTMKEKFIESSHLFMLLNLRTHIRNSIANAISTPLRSLKDRVSALGQNAYKLFKPDFEVTQSLTGSIGGEYKKIGEEVYEKYVKEGITGADKWQDSVKTGVKNKQIFKDNAITGAVNKAVGKGAGSMLEFVTDGKVSKESVEKIFGEKLTDSALENLRQFNYWLLGTVEDDPFVKKNFVNRLASYMKAQNIKNIADIPDDAIAIATQEALKATFKDTNKMTELLSTMKNKTGLFGEIALPFTKTPANLAVRSYEYSPLGAINAIKAAKSGKEASKVIDELATSLTGTALILVGYKLAENGIITGKYSDDKDQAAFQKQQGQLEYALHVGDNYYTYDWAQPASIPFIIGTEIYNAIKEGDDEQKSLMQRIKTGARNAIIASGDAWFNQSPLQSVSEMVGGGEYSSDSIMENVLGQIESAPSRFVPSLMGAVARTEDPVMRQTYTNGNPVKTQLDTIKSRIPGLSKDLPISYDTWGNPRTRSDSKSEAAFAQFINPGQLGNNNSTKIDPEIERLYEATGENGVFPRKAEWSVTIDDNNTKKLTNEEYSKYQEQMGKTSYDMASTLIDSSAYKGMKNDMKVDVLSDMYGISRAITLREQFGKPVPKVYSKVASIYDEKGAEGLVQYYEIKNGVDIDGNKRISKEEAMKRLDSLNLTQAQKRYYFSFMSKAENPY